MHPFVFVSLTIVFCIYYFSYSRFLPWYATVVRMPSENRIMRVITAIAILTMTVTVAAFVYHYVSWILIASANSTVYESTLEQLQALTAELEWWINPNPNSFTYFIVSFIYLVIYGLIEPFL